MIIVKKEDFWKFSDEAYRLSEDYEDVISLIAEKIYNGNKLHYKEYPEQAKSLKQNIADDIDNLIENCLANPECNVFMIEGPVYMCMYRNLEDVIQINVYSEIF